MTGNQGPLKLNIYQFSYQWSLQHQIVKDFDVFWQGFYNASALPRLRHFDLLEVGSLRTRNPIAVVTGLGGIWTVNDRLAIFGSYNFGLTQILAHDAGLPRLRRGVLNPRSEPAMSIGPIITRREFKKISHTPS